MMESKSYHFLNWLICLTALASCSELIEVDKPRSQLMSARVFQDDLTAIAAISGLYAPIESGGLTTINYLCGLSADELKVEQGAEQLQFYRNEIFPTNGNVSIFWGGYAQIYKANSIIEGLESGNVTADLKNQLIGEAKFFRAFYHFYLVNLFGDIPYIKTTDYRVNGLVSRMPVSEVYQNIVNDLLEAKTLLSENYAHSNNERVRVNKWVATSLLARVYLYQGTDWLHAEEQASVVINKNSLYNLCADPNKVFLKNSTETVWQVPTGNRNYTIEGDLFIRASYDPAIATISNELSNAFELNDSRKGAWVGEKNNGVVSWYHSLKYKENSLNGTGAEYYTIFRLAEQYLIRAEARAQQNKLTGPNSAESDINAIRGRAGLPPTTASTKQDLLLAIEQERRIELFLEWGHRWLDLKRTGRASVLLGSLKPEWSDPDQLYPIPYTELQLNSKMIQNPGY